MNDRQKLFAVKQAFLRLSSGGKKDKPALFAGTDAEGELGWQSRILGRMRKEELVIWYGKYASDPKPEYEAVDDDYLRKLARNEVALSQWLFNPSASAPTTVEAESTQMVLPTASPPPLPMPPPLPARPLGPFDPPPLVTAPAPSTSGFFGGAVPAPTTAATPTPPPLPATVNGVAAKVLDQPKTEVTESAPSQNDETLAQILDTLILCAQNIVLIRDKVLQIGAKVDRFEKTYEIDLGGNELDLDGDDDKAEDENADVNARPKIPTGVRPDVMRQWRLELGLSLREAGKLIGRSKSAMDRLERKAGS